MKCLSYSCRFSSYFTNINVSEPPIIVGGTEEVVVTVVEGGSTFLRCLASGIPEPIISWSKVSSSLPFYKPICFNRYQFTLIYLLFPFPLQKYKEMRITSIFLDF